MRWQTSLSGKQLALVLVLSVALVALAGAHEEEIGIGRTLPALPWELNVSQTTLDDLRLRLENAHLPDELSDVHDWSYGTPKSFVERMREYWLTKYDWPARQRLINQELVSQYTTEIGGLKVHFAEARSDNASAVPLIITHGWPGSVLECRKIIPHLRSHFHVICPSIPGYFFSEAPKETDFDVKKVAETFIQLMKKIGYRRYLAHGGDWGSEVTRWIGILDPECVGTHFTMMSAQLPIVRYKESLLWSLWMSAKSIVQLLLPSYFFTESEQWHLQRLAKYAISGSAYMAYHTFLPQSLSYAMVDSPLGQAAYLWEKYHEWTDLKGTDDLLTVYSEDELIDLAMVYWVSKCFPSSLRLYAESIPSLFTTPLPYNPKPTAVAAFRYEIIMLPQAWAAQLHNIVRWENYPVGGHFSHLEVPELFSSDVIAFASSISDNFIHGFKQPLHGDEDDFAGFEPYRKKKTEL